MAETTVFVLGKLHETSWDEVESPSLPRGNAMSFSRDAVVAIDVPADCGVQVSAEGAVLIGLDPLPAAEGEERRWGRQVTIPAWRVIEVRTTS